MNLDADKNEPCAVSSLVYNEDDDILYTGDEKGCINAYKFDNIFKKLDLLEPGT
jgi:6-phosphogluconolactonase (cycloisomerase 2 family)